MRTVIFPVSAVLVRLTIPAIGLALFGLLGILYVDQPDRYQSIMLALIKLPIWRPFVDWEWVTSAVKCWNEGVNVYISNPCDRFFPRGVGFNYSPLWLRVTFLRFADGRTNLFGITIGALFFLSLALLPPPRTKLDLGSACSRPCPAPLPLLWSGLTPTLSCF